MSFYTYILFSNSSDHLYIGSTNNLEDRLIRHNNNRNQYTRGRGPWRIIFSQSFDTRSDAVKLERLLKSKKDPKRILKWIDEQAG